jgi:hypothetical protein
MANKKHCELSEHTRKGRAAMAHVRRAKKAGLLPPVKTRTCVDCGAQATCYDHRDYGKPLMVEPVCYKCNSRRGPAISTGFSLLSPYYVSNYKPKEPIEAKRERESQK